MTPGFQRHLLPAPMSYFASAGLKLIGRGAWRATRCVFHQDKNPSLRINVDTGAFRCMSCGAKGGDVLAFHRLHYGLSFVQAAKDLRAWV